MIWGQSYCFKWKLGRGEVTLSTTNAFTENESAEKCGVNSNSVSSKNVSATVQLTPTRLQMHLLKLRYFQSSFLSLYTVLTKNFYCFFLFLIAFLLHLLLIIKAFISKMHIMLYSILPRYFVFIQMYLWFKMIYIWLVDINIKIIFTMIIYCKNISEFRDN